MNSSRCRFLLNLAVQPQYLSRDRAKFDAFRLLETRMVLPAR
jgi:hypothetical protein